jgi:hypothetical protein
MIIVSKKPMQEGVGRSTSYTYRSLDKAIDKFKNVCEEVKYEYKHVVADGYPRYTAGGVGFEYRIELNVISSSLETNNKTNSDEH